MSKLSAHTGQETQQHHFAVYWSPGMLSKIIQAWGEAYLIPSLNVHKGGMGWRVSVDVDLAKERVQIRGNRNGKWVVHEYKSGGKFKGYRLSVNEFQMKRVARMPEFALAETMWVSDSNEFTVAFVPADDRVPPRKVKRDSKKRKAERKAARIAQEKLDAERDAERQAAAPNPVAAKQKVFHTTTQGG
jgi:hypothetical protein